MQFSQTLGDNLVATQATNRKWQLVTCMLYPVHMSEASNKGQHAYTVVAHRRKKWWELTVTADGFSTRVRTRHLDQAAELARKAIASRLNSSERSFAIDLVFDLPIEIQAHIDRTRIALQRAAEARAQAALLGHTTAGVLRERGLGKRDIGMLMGVSPGKAAKLLGAYKG